MKPTLENKLVIGIASSALFDLTESQEVFDSQGIEAYRAYQDANIDRCLEPGVAFGFIEALLSLNKMDPSQDLVEVIIMSKNDPTTGLRLMRSIRTLELGIERAIFSQGRAPLAFVRAFNMSLFLSGDEADVRRAIDAGLPAGKVLGTAAPHGSKEDPTDTEIRVAFDFDGVLASDESEKVFDARGITEFLKHEETHSATPLPSGPLRDFLLGLGRIQQIEREHQAGNPDYSPRVRVSLVTARQAPAHERAIASLREWGTEVNDAFFLGGLPKGPVLATLRPHIMFDDQSAHLDPVAGQVASVHIPYGIKNQAPPHDAAGN